MGGLELQRAKYRDEELPSIGTGVRRPAGWNVAVNAIFKQCIAVDPFSKPMRYRRATASRQEARADLLPRVGNLARLYWRAAADDRDALLGQSR
jgi:hypothetical protein